MTALKMHCLYLGVLSTDVSAKEKFILTDGGILLFGRVLYHKELVHRQFKREDVRVIAAGTIPDDYSSDLENWGWKSTGYGIVTDQELRPNIVNKILEYKAKSKI